jgi:hypothetical protein
LAALLLLIWPVLFLPERDFFTRNWFVSRGCSNRKQHRCGEKTG